MSYERSYGQHLVPNGSGVLAADDFTGAAVHGEYVCIKNFDFKMCKAAITTALVSTVSVQVAFYKRSAPGVSAAQVLLGTLIIPALTAVGKVMYKSVTPVEFLPGNALAFEVTVAAAGGGAAGGGLYGFDYEDSPEQPANEVSMVLSA